MTTHGFEITQEPVFKLHENSTEIGIGEAVLKALNSYRHDVPTPPLNDRQPDPLLEFIGVKTWGQLERSSRCILITEKLGSISATPTAHSPQGGYDHLNGLAVRCLPSADEIGAAVRRAAELCS